MKLVPVGHFEITFMYYVMNRQWLSLVREHLLAYETAVLDEC